MGRIAVVFSLFPLNIAPRAAPVAQSITTDIKCGRLQENPISLASRTGKRGFWVPEIMKEMPKRRVRQKGILNSV